MDYKTSSKVTISFDPWFTKEKNNGIGFVMLHIYEELGGKMSHGEMVVIHDQSDKAKEIYTKKNYGLLKITKEEGESWEIPCFIYNKEYDWTKNLIHMQFFCGIRDKKFVSDYITNSWEKEKIDNVIKAVYPGKVDFRTVLPDITTPLNYYQNRQTGYEFLTNLLYGYKKNTVFTFGWEGITLKEIYGKLNSEGKQDCTLKWISDTSTVMKSGYSDNYTPRLYKLPKNPWEDSTVTPDLKKDYTKYESPNLRVYWASGDLKYIQKDYAVLRENEMTNKINMKEGLFSEITLTIDEDVPNCKIGDVVYHRRMSETTQWATLYPYNYYLVYSNELFIAVNSSDYRDSEGKQMTWRSKLLGLEQKGSIAIGTEKDPLDGQTLDSQLS